LSVMDRRIDGVTVHEMQKAVNESLYAGQPLYLNVQRGTVSHAPRGPYAGRCAGDASWSSATVLVDVGAPESDERPAPRPPAPRVEWTRPEELILRRIWAGSHASLVARMNAAAAALPRHTRSAISRKARGLGLTGQPSHLVHYPTEQEMCHGHPAGRWRRDKRRRRES
jgi:hypothetical protein